MTLQQDRASAGLIAREVNDRIAVLDWADPEQDDLDFLCERGASDCVGVVTLTLAECGVLRQGGAVLMEGHSAE